MLREMRVVFHFYLDEVAMCRRIFAWNAGVPIALIFTLLVITGCLATDAVTAPDHHVNKDIRVRVTRASGDAALPTFIAALKRAGLPADIASVHVTIDGRDSVLTPSAAIAALQVIPSSTNTAVGNLVRADMSDVGTDVPNVGFTFHTLSLGGAYDGSTGHLNAFLAANPSSGGGNHVTLSVTYSTMDYKGRGLITDQTIADDVDGTTATVNAEVPMGPCDFLSAGALYQFHDGGSGKWFTATNRGTSPKVPGCTANPCLPDENRLTSGATLIHATFLIPSVAANAPVLHKSSNLTSHPPSPAADQEISCSGGGSGTGGGGGGGGGDDGDGGGGGGWIITYCIHTDYYAADGTYLFTTDDGCFEEEA